jgi:hypothetical protein
MVIRDVGDEDIIIIGYMFSAQNVTGQILTDGKAGTHFVYEPGLWNLEASNRQKPCLYDGIKQRYLKVVSQ